MAILPTEKTKPKADLKQLKILIQGQPKVGKSTLLSQIPNALIAATEQGLDALSVYKADVGSWQDFLDLAKEFTTAKHNFNPLCIDTIDNLYQFCTDFVCKKNEVDYPHDLEFGKGWYLVSQEFERVLTKLSFGDHGLILTSHSKIEKIKTRGGREITKAVPDVQPAARRFLLGFIDIILYADIMDGEKGPVRVLRSEPSEAWEAGDRTGKLKPEMAMQWKALEDCFKKEAK